MAQYSIIFWTVQGAYVVEYKALPYIYTYSFLGQHTAPISGQAAVAYSGTVMWPAADGFWRFDGTRCSRSAVRSSTGSSRPTTTRRPGPTWAAGSTAPRPSSGGASRRREARLENDTLIIYNFQEQWWSIGKLHRTCGVPGSIRGYPLMASVNDDLPARARAPLPRHAGAAVDPLRLLRRRQRHRHGDDKAAARRYRRRA